jgi:hypothetical protein
MVSQDRRFSLRRVRFGVIHCINPGIRRLEATGPASRHSKPSFGDCAGHRLAHPSSFRFLSGYADNMKHTMFSDILQDWSTSRVMSSIKTMLPDDCAVLRNGAQTEINAAELVPGDILHVRLGDKLPADIRFIEASPDAKFDRSILTGMINTAFHRRLEVDDLRGTN